MKQRLFSLVTLLLAYTLGALADGVHFQYEPRQYPDETVIYAAFTNASGERIDEYGYLGAFIGGECRYEATAQYDQTAGHTYFLLRVQGNVNTEANAEITFRYYRMPATGGPGREYWIDNTTATFTGDDRSTEMSNPLLIKFVPADVSFKEHDLKLHRDNTFSLLSNLELDPAEGLIPQLTWEVSIVAKDEDYESGEREIFDEEMLDRFFTLDGNNLTVKRITTEDTTIVVKMYAGDEFLDMMGIEVDAPATKATLLEEYRAGVTIPVGDQQMLAAILESCYTLTPADATTTFTWTSSDEEVVRFEETMGLWSALKAGNVTMTGTPTDDSPVTLTLQVTVVQMVSHIQLTNKFLLAEVGEDITDRLTAMAKAYPSNATTPTLKWTLQASDMPSVELSNNRYVARTVTGSEEKFIVESTDGSGVSEVVYVGVVPKQPTKLEAKTNPLHLSFPADEDQVDITADLKGNVVTTPQDLDMNDYYDVLSPMLKNLAIYAARAFANNQNVDPQMMQQYLETALYFINNKIDFSFEFDKAESELVSIDEDDEANPIYHLNGSGEFKATAGMTQANLKVFDNLDELLAQANQQDDIDALFFTPITVTFDVVVADGLKGFMVPDVTLVNGGSIQITLVEQPVGSAFDKDAVSLAVVADAREFPANWNYADCEKVSTDESGLTFNINAHCLGKGKIIVMYDGEESGQGSMAVLQNINMTDGWQWISLQQGSISSIDEMNEAFGEKLSEVRSQEQMTINDSKYKYVGDLSEMVPGKTYKLRMNLGADAQKTFAVKNLNNGDYLANFATEQSVNALKGWNWIGNPYQYYQNLTDIFGNTLFKDGDIVKCKNGFAMYSNGGWTGGLTSLTPGEGMLIYMNEGTNLFFAPESQMAQNETAPLTARAASSQPRPWTFDGSRFDDNMAMVAHIGGVDDPSRVTLWAFVDGECRGCGQAIGDRQFITVHGNMGEKVTFAVYDELTGKFHQVYGTRQLMAAQGTVKQPVNLFAGQVLSVDDALFSSPSANKPVYDLQGRRVSEASAKGVYVSGGRKFIVK